MKSELIVDVQPREVSIALLEDGRLVSLQKESRNIAYAVGDIYVAKVKKLMPGLNAAFVNVGYEKDAFLHYLDLGPHFSSYSEFMKQLLADDKKGGKAPMPDITKMKLLPDIDKHGTVTEQLNSGDELMVQIVKEPISSKGPRQPRYRLPDATWCLFLSAIKSPFRRKSRLPVKNFDYAILSKASNLRISV
jgi:ribonuclease G